MRFWVLAIVLTGVVSAGAEASVLGLFQSLLDSIKAFESQEDESNDGGSETDPGGSDSGGSDSGGSDSGGSDSGGGDVVASGYEECMASVAGSYDTRCMLTALIDEIVMPNYVNLANQGATFSSQDGPLGNYCSAISTGQEESAFSSAESAYKELVKAVQRVEMHAIGPAADNSFSLQYRLNSYMAGPISTCGIDSIAASSNVDISARPSSTRGIRALDYLLFNTDLDHTCAQQVTATKGWNDLTQSERKSLRCDAAMLVASDLESAASSILKAWQKTDGNYRAEFLEESNTFLSLQATTDSMFYLEKGTKDAKVGMPLGIIAACPNLTCPEFVEAPYSGNSLQNVITNLEIWSEMFSSNSQTGFDAHIENEGWPEVSQEFKSNLIRALDLANSIDESIASQVNSIQSESQETECTNAFSNPDTTSGNFPMCTLYGLLKRIVDSLKIDFVTIVNVEIPGGSQSDND